MRLPTWIPKIPRPYNPAYGPVWDKMSDNEKRWSFLFDAGVVAFLLLCVILFGK